MTEKDDRDVTPILDAPDQALILVSGHIGDEAEASSIPSPLLRIGERAFLDYILENCGRFGFRKILLLVEDHAEAVETYARSATFKGLSSSLALDVLRCPAGCGSAGALRHAADRIDERFLLIRGDCYSDTNWLDLVTAKDPPDAVVVMAACDVSDPAPDAAIYRARQPFEFPSNTNPALRLAGRGLYLVRRDIVAWLPERGSIESDVLPAVAAQGGLGIVAQPGFLLDLSAPGAAAIARSEMPKRSRRRAVFFDRDGTLNVDDGYTHRPDDLVFLPGAIAAVKRVNDLGYFAFLVTNQAGIAKGHFREDDMHAFHEHLQRSLRAAGAHLDDIRYCPDHPEGTVAPYVRPSEFRKPAPGMLLDLMTTWPVVKDGSIVVGDRQSDVDAASAAGLRGALYSGGDLDQFVAGLLDTNGR